MKLSFLFGIMVLFFFAGCEYNNITPVAAPANDNSVSFEINYTDYSNCCYFIDAVYADTSAQLNLFNKYYGNIVPVIVPRYRISSFELYISDSYFYPVTNIKGWAYLNLPVRKSAALYDDSLRYNQTPVIGEKYSGNFRRLEYGQDYIFQSETGYINLINEPADGALLAVAYKTDEGSYGEFESEIINGQKDQIVLKMIKPPYLNPDMKDAWKLQLKNIYRIDLGTIIKSIDLNIYYKINNLLFSSWYSDSFLRLFGFDQINSSEAPVPDGKFDQRPYFTYLPSTSDIIFPVLQPFGNNCPKQVLDLSYHAIYDSSKSSLTQKDGFVIKGSIVPD